MPDIPSTSAKLGPGGLKVPALRRCATAGTNTIAPATHADAEPRPDNRGAPGRDLRARGEAHLADAAAGREPRETSSLTNDTGTAPPIICIWTDGACIGNPGPGGWAYVTTVGGEIDSRFGHCCAQTTNIEMEMVAVIQALRSVKHLDRPVTVYIDLEYISKGMNEWLPRWEKNGWRTNKRKPVAHRQLWEELKALRDARGPGAEITFAWIQGHAGHAENEEADRLAQAAAAVASRSARSCRTRYDAEAGLMVPK